MKDLQKSFESAAKVMKATKEDRSIWNKSYYSLSRLLRDMQTKTGLKMTAPIFEQLGLPTGGKVRPADVLALVPNFKETKSGEKLPAYISRTKKVEELPDGTKKDVLDADGKPVYEYKLSAVREGQWSLDKLCKILAAE